MSRKRTLTIVFRFGTLSAPLATDGIVGVIARYGLPATDFVLDSGRAIALAATVSNIVRSRKTTFHLAGQGFEFDLSSVRNYSLNFLEVAFLDLCTIPADAWAEQFIANPNFVMAWLVDTDYDHWQNAFDPLQYTSGGRSFAALPMKSNGLPDPLESMIIDTSSNPGRRVLRNGFIEAVGSTMWLGENFWVLTGAARAEVKSRPWITSSDLAPDVLRIQTANRCFTSADGESGEIQNELRSLLYPKAVKTGDIHVE